jgi:hypothetical protein
VSRRTPHPGRTIRLRKSIPCSYASRALFGANRARILLHDARKSRERGRSSVLPQLRDSKPRCRHHLQQVQLQLEGRVGAEVQGNDADESAATAPEPGGFPRRGTTDWTAPCSAGRTFARRQQAEGYDGRRGDDVSVSAGCAKSGRTKPRSARASLRGARAAPGFWSPAGVSIRYPGERGAARGSWGFWRAAARWCVWSASSGVPVGHGRAILRIAQCKSDGKHDR